LLAFRLCRCDITKLLLACVIFVTHLKLSWGCCLWTMLKTVVMPVCWLPYHLHFHHYTPIWTHTVNSWNKGNNKTLGVGSNTFSVSLLKPLSSAWTALVIWLAPWPCSFGQLISFNHFFSQSLKVLVRVCAVICMQRENLAARFKRAALGVLLRVAFQCMLGDIHTRVILFLCL
jgi:hypothetical protein